MCVCECVLCMYIKNAMRLSPELFLMDTIYIKPFIIYFSNTLHVPRGALVPHSHMCILYVV